ncbi:MAG TPA: hypothetical protein ENK25_01380 [Bacteroidetes bacterium]|nr:hypothetical protein [Bacteroidota bacterium]
MRTAIRVILFIVIVVLSYYLYQSIMEPIRFNREKKIREKAAIERLKAIRKAEVAYKTKYGKYTGSFDTLIHFVKYDSFPIIKAIGSIPDSLYGLITDEEAIKKGIIIRDTSYIPVIDTLFGRNFPIDSLRYVPYCDTAQFFLDAGVIETASKVKVPVFEAHVLNDVLLHGLNKQLIINYNAEREKIVGFPGLKVGSLTEATNNAGNWE